MKVLVIVKTFPLNISFNLMNSNVLLLKKHLILIFLMTYVCPFPVSKQKTFLNEISKLQKLNQSIFEERQNNVWRYVYHVLFTALLPVVTGGTQKDFFVVLFCFSYKKLLEIPSQYTFYPFSFYNINAILFTDYYMKNGGIFCS